MYEIWFSFRCVNYKVEVELLSEAILIWDKLNEQFHMVSARP
jgi:hypothetical protein